MKAFLASVPRQAWVIIGVVWTVALLVIILTLAGCASQGQVYDSGFDEPTEVKTSTSSGDFTVNNLMVNGREVTCITWASWDYINDAMKSGMDCLEAKPE